VMIDEVSRPDREHSLETASIARRQMQCAASQIKLLAGDCGIWCEFAPI
jgi:hypothetical protein